MKKQSEEGLQADHTMRDVALEDAAHIVEGHYWDSLNYKDIGEGHGASIAKMIRALKKNAAELPQALATATMDRAVSGEAPRPDGSPCGTLRQPATAAPTSCLTLMDAAQLQAIARVCDMYLHEDYGHRLRNISTAITDHLRAAPADHLEPDAIVVSEGMSDRALIDRFTNCPVGTRLYKNK